MEQDLATRIQNVVVDRSALARQARATLLRTLRNADFELTDKAIFRPIPEDHAPLLRLFSR
jgi:hypothetical protein